MLTKRVEVLFEPDEYRLLEEKARKAGRSVGSLVRAAVTERYLRPSDQERAEAFRWLASQTFEGIGGDWEEIKAELEAERYRQIVKSIETD